MVRGGVCPSFLPRRGRAGVCVACPCSVGVLAEGGLCPSHAGMPPCGARLVGSGALSSVPCILLEASFASCDALGRPGALGLVWLMLCKCFTFALWSPFLGSGCGSGGCPTSLSGCGCDLWCPGCLGLRALCDGATFRGSFSGCSGLPLGAFALPGILASFAGSCSFSLSRSVPMFGAKAFCLDLPPPPKGEMW